MSPTSEQTTLADNILHFGRLLRAAGLRVGSGQIADATAAVAAAGVGDRARLYWALHTAFVKRRSERELFDQAFAIFWRDPGFLKRMMTMMIPQTLAPPQPDQQRELARRLSEALTSQSDDVTKPKPDDIEVEAFETFSPNQVDRHQDFAQMSAEELADAMAAVRRIRLVREEITTRRRVADKRGRDIHLRRMLRDAAQKGPDHLLLQRRRRKRQRPPLVVLCDISGSMEQYARVFLHFLYALKSDHGRVSCFLFATRLYDVTRKLQDRDPDVAIAAVGSGVTDWSGGTRIGHCLGAFNQQWARRVLGQNAQVLVFTDGLDRDAGDGMTRAVRRLAASCRKLVWVNPLLRYDRYQPLAAGARILDRYASETRSCHNVASLADLARALNGDGT